MAKKIKNPKLITKHTSNSSQPSKKISAFNQHATKLQIAKQKKIQKLRDTKDRVLNKKRQNKIVRMPGQMGNLKKIKKFALLDEDGEAGPVDRGLTHKGKDFNSIKYFNDMNFDEDEEIEEIQKMQVNLNFDGFEDQNEKVKNEENKPKSKADVYKEIIDKSKKFKRERQQQYEQNFEKAVELDEQFSGIISQLKFRDQVTKTREKIEKTDKDYEKLINDLKEDQRVVANKVIVNDSKGKQKQSKRRNEQLKKILKQDSDSDEEDVRGWVKGVESDESSEQSIESEDSQEISDNDDEEEEDDELDDVQLSSGDEQEESNEEQQSEQDKEIQIIESESEQSPQIMPSKKARKQQKIERKMKK